MLCQGICDKLIIAIENLSRNEYSKRFFFILLTSGNALLFLKLCVFLISSPPPPVLFRNFQKWLEMVLFSARLGNGICSGTNHWCWSLAGNEKWPISKLSRENILKWPYQSWPPGTNAQHDAHVGPSHKASMLGELVLTAQGDTAAPSSVGPGLILQTEEQSWGRPQVAPMCQREVALAPCKGSGKAESSCSPLALVVACKLQTLLVLG